MKKVKNWSSVVSIRVGNSQMIWFFACKEKFKHRSFVVSYKIWKQEKGVFFAYKETSQKLIFYCLTVKTRKTTFNIQISGRKARPDIVSARRVCSGIAIFYRQTLLYSLFKNAQILLALKMRPLNFWPCGWGPSNIWTSQQRWLKGIGGR